MDITDFQDKISLVIAKYASRLPSDVKEDLRQEGYLFLLKAGNVTDKGHAYILARNRILDVIYKRCRIIAKEKSFDEKATSHEAEGYTDVSGLFDEEDEEQGYDDGPAFLDLVETLTDQERLVTRLVYEYGYTEEQVAKSVNIPLRTVQRRKADARKKIKIHLGRRANGN